MKKHSPIYILVILTNFLIGQTQHKLYNTNYCGTGYCNQTTVIHANRHYIAYIEDTLTTPINKPNLVVMKNDLNGNVLWKKTYQFYGSYTATATPRKILASGSRIYIGGNLYEPTGNYPFIASIDTTSGNLIYLNRYTNSFTSNDIKINDLTLLNNGDIMAVGRIAAATNKYFYCLRVVGATGSIINNGMSTFYNDQEAFGICQFSNSSIFVVGQRGGYPFIAKLSNTANFLPSCQYNVSGILPVTSSFNKIIKSGNYLTVMGNSSSSIQNDMLGRIDSTISNTFVTPYILNIFTGNTFVPLDIAMKGSQLMASGITPSGNSVLFFTPFISFTNGKSYGSSLSLNHSLHFNYPSIYLTTGTWNAGSNLRLYKTDSIANTACAANVTPTYSVLTVNYSIGQIGIFTSGSLTPVTPGTYTNLINPVTTCLATEVTDLSNAVEDIQLLTQFNAYTFSSPLTPIENIEVYDINGKLIYDSHIIHSNSHTFDISHLNSGLYFARITYGTNQKTVKLIKS